MRIRKKIAGRIVINKKGDAIVKAVRRGPPKGYHSEVYTILWLLGHGLTVEQVARREKIDIEDVLACLQFAAMNLTRCCHKEHKWHLDPDEVIADNTWQDPPTAEEIRRCMRYLH